MLRKSLALGAFIAVGVLGLASPVFADKCKDPIVDEVSAVDSSSKEKLQSAMAALTNMGADARVMFLSSYHRDVNGDMHKNIAGYKATMLAKCRSWQAADGGFKNNLILFIVVSKKQAHAVYYGSQWAPRLSAHESRYSSDMSGRFRDGDLVGGVLMGLGDVADLLSVKPSQEGKPVVINHPTDYSGLWKVFGWLAVLSIVGLLVWLAFWVFGQIEKRRKAQRDAQTERGQCSQALSVIEGELAILKSKVSQTALSPEWVSRINGVLDQAERKFAQAASEFNGLNRSANNPDTPRLSVMEYVGMGGRYAGAAALFAEAEELVREAEEELRRAIRGEEPRKPLEPPREPKPQSGPAGTAAADVESHPKAGARSQASGRSDAPRTVHHHHETVIIRESPDIIPTPIIIDDRDRSGRRYEDRWAGERERDPDVPVIAREPSRSGGSEIGWSKSGSGGGQEQSWGASGIGSGHEQPWSQPDTSFGGSSHTEEVSRTGY